MKKIMLILLFIIGISDGCDFHGIFARVIRMFITDSFWKFFRICCRNQSQNILPFIPDFMTEKVYNFCKSSPEPTENRRQQCSRGFVLYGVNKKKDDCAGCFWYNILWCLAILCKSNWRRLPKWTVSERINE